MALQASPGYAPVQNQGVAQPGQVNPYGVAGGPLNQPHPFKPNIAPTLSGGPQTSAYGPSAGPQPWPTQSPAQSLGQEGALTGPITADPNIMNSMQQFANAAYNNQTSRLDPQWQQRQNAFDQQMVSQGIMPGSQAYNNAFQNFSQSQNDAYSQAYNNSFATGLAAQNQGFNQAALPYQLQNALQIASTNAGGQVAAAGASANASMHNADQANATNQLLGLGNLGLGYDNMQQQGNQYDIGNLMAMYGMGNQNTMYNNGLIGGADNQLFGMVPNGNATPIDVTGAYGMNQAGQNAQYQGQVAGANGQNQMYGELGTAAVMAMMMMCSKELKDDHGEADANETLAAVNALPLRKWNYKGDATPHIGTYAEDFNEQLGLPKQPVINVLDMLGALLGSVQALTKRIESLETQRA